MLIATIISCLILLIAPALIIRSAMQCKQAKALGAKGGFHCPSALSSQNAWDWAQKLASVRLFVAGIVMAVLGVGFMLLMPATDLISLLFCAGIAFGLEIVALLFIMTTIEMSLQNHIKPSAQ